MGPLGLSGYCDHRRRRLSSRSRCEESGRLGHSCCSSCCHRRSHLRLDDTTSHRLQEDALEPNPQPSIDSRSRYGLVQFRLVNKGQTAAHDLSVRWKVPLSTVEGNVVSLGDGGTLAVLVPGDSLSVVLGEAKLFFDKFPSTTASGVLSFSNASGDVLSREFVVTAEHERSALRHDREEPKTHYELQKIPAALDKISDEIASIRNDLVARPNNIDKARAPANIEWSRHADSGDGARLIRKRSPDRTKALAWPDRIHDSTLTRINQTDQPWTGSSITRVRQHLYTLLAGSDSGNTRGAIVDARVPQVSGRTLARQRECRRPPTTRYSTHSFSGCVWAVIGFALRVVRVTYRSTPTEVVRSFAGGLVAAP